MCTFNGNEFLVDLESGLVFNLNQPEVEVGTWDNETRRISWLQPPAGSEQESSLWRLWTPGLRHSPTAQDTQAATTATVAEHEKKEQSRPTHKRTLPSNLWDSDDDGNEASPTTANSVQPQSAEESPTPQRPQHSEQSEHALTEYRLGVTKQRLESEKAAEERILVDGMESRSTTLARERALETVARAETINTMREQRKQAAQPDGAENAVEVRAAFSDM